jgi:hypothetical protein
MGECEKKLVTDKTISSAAHYDSWTSSEGIASIFLNLQYYMKESG